MRYMKQIIIESERMTNQAAAENYLKELLEIASPDQPDLDAIYMRVMSIKEETEISISDSDLLIDYLGRYGLGLVKLFRDAASESDFIHFTF